MKLMKNKDNGEQIEENGSVVSKCSCYGKPLKTRTSSSLSMNAPTPSPRLPLLAGRNENGHSGELPHIKYMELKFNSDNESEVQEDENVSNGVALSYSLQILDENIIPMTPNDVLVDALVSSSGVIPISSAA